MDRRDRDFSKPLSSDGQRSLSGKSFGSDYNQRAEAALNSAKSGGGSRGAGGGQPSPPAFSPKSDDLPPGSRPLRNDYADRATAALNNAKPAGSEAPKEGLGAKGEAAKAEAPATSNVTARPEGVPKTNVAGENYLDEYLKGKDGKEGLTAKVDKPGVSGANYAEEYKQRQEAKKPPAPEKPPAPSKSDVLAQQREQMLQVQRAQNQQAEREKQANNDLRQRARELQNQIQYFQAMVGTQNESDDTNIKDTIQNMITELNTIPPNLR